MDDRSPAPGAQMLDAIRVSPQFTGNGRCSNGTGLIPALNPAGRGSIGSSDQQTCLMNDTHPFNKNQIMNSVFSQICCRTRPTRPEPRPLRAIQPQMKLFFWLDFNMFNQFLF
jgi:hypothetical protein